MIEGAGHLHWDENFSIKEVLLVQMRIRMRALIYVLMLILSNSDIIIHFLLVWFVDGIYVCFKDFGK